MEQIHGRTLEEEIQYRAEHSVPWTPEEFIALGNAIDENIERMNEHNLHHRDLHLRNVMVSDSGETHIIDFGRCKQSLSSEEETEIYQGSIYQDGKRITLSFIKDQHVRVTLAIEAKKHGLIAAPTLDKKSKV